MKESIILGLGYLILLGIMLVAAVPFNIYIFLTRHP